MGRGVMHTWINDVIVIQNHFVGQFCDSMNNVFPIFSNLVGTLLDKVPVQIRHKCSKLKYTKRFQFRIMIICY